MHQIETKQEEGVKELYLKSRFKYIKDRTAPKNLIQTSIMNHTKTKRFESQEIRSSKITEIETVKTNWENSYSRPTKFDDRRLKLRWPEL